MHLSPDGTTASLAGDFQVTGSYKSTAYPAISPNLSAEKRFTVGWQGTPDGQPASATFVIGMEGSPK